MNQWLDQSLRYSGPEQKWNCAMVQRDFKETYALMDWAITQNPPTEQCLRPWSLCIAENKYVQKTVE